MSNSTSPKAFILAAGRGERLRPLTDHIPKPLISVQGKPLIAHTLEKLHKVGIKDIVMNISHLAEQFPNVLGTGKRWGVNITYSYEPEALGVGGGIFQALPLLGKKPFLVISGDIFTDFPFQTLEIKHNTLAHLVLTPNPDFHPTGDYSVTKEGFLSQKPEFTYASFGMIDPKLFAKASPGNFSFIPLINEQIPHQKITAEIYQDTWFNIGTTKELEILEKYLQKT